MITGHNSMQSVLNYSAWWQKHILCMNYLCWIITWGDMAWSWNHDLFSDHTGTAWYRHVLTICLESWYESEMARSQNRNVLIASPTSNNYRAISVMCFSCNLQWWVWSREDRKYEADLAVPGGSQRSTLVDRAADPWSQSRHGRCCQTSQFCSHIWLNKIMLIGSGWTVLWEYRSDLDTTS